MLGPILSPEEESEIDKVIRKGGPRSPLTFQALPSQDVPDQRSLQELTEKLVGRRCPNLAYELGVLTDETPFGIESQQQNVWHIAGAMVNVSGSNGDVIHVPIHLVVDDKSARLLVAFTESKEVWIWPAVDDSLAETAEETASNHRISIQELDRQLTKNLSEVLSKVHERGIDPGTAGQIVLRPRTILSQFPAVDVGPDGVGSPNTIPYAYWIVEALGILERQRLPVKRWYSSECLLFVNDELPDVWFGQYAP